MQDPNRRADRGAAILDRRIIPENFDWREYDSVPERTKVRPASDFSSILIDQIFAEGQHQGAYWPWAKANEKGLRFRRQEVTVYAGINGHRKSTLVGQIALSLMNQDEPCLMASFEMTPQKTLERMVKQSAGCATPTMRYIKSWSQWTDGRLWLYDHLGQCDARQILAVARYATAELGVKHIFIDSMMKIVSGVDDYNGQKRFVADLGTLAMASDCHVHLVAHARKGKDETDKLDKFDVKGAGEIIDQAHNAVLVQKNLRGAAGDVEMFVTVAKQRDGAYEGTLGFWFNGDAMTFGEKPGGRWPPIVPQEFREAELEREPGQEG